MYSCSPAREIAGLVSTVRKIVAEWNNQNYVLCTAEQFMVYVMRAHIDVACIAVLNVDVFKGILDDLCTTGTVHYWVSESGIEYYKIVFKDGTGL